MIEGLFKQVSARPFCLFRLLWGAMLLQYYLISYWIFHFYYGPEGVFYLTGAGSFLSDAQWSVFECGIRPAYLFPLMYGLALISALGLIVGKYPRLSSFLAWFCACSFTNCISMGLNGADLLLKNISFYLMVGAFMGCANLHFSKDAGKDEDATEEQLMPVWVYRMFQLQLCMVYFFSGLGKLAEVEWQNGTAMNVWFHFVDGWMRYDYRWILAYPALGALITTTVWLWELILFPIGVWVRALRPWVLGIGVLFQLGLLFGMRVYPFSVVPFVIYICFLEDSEIRWAENQIHKLVNRGKVKFQRLMQFSTG